MSNSSIGPIHKTLSGATTPGQSGPESNGDEWVLCILQCSSITGASPSDYLLSYPVYCLTPEAPLFRGIPTGFKAFLEPLGVCRLLSCTWFPSKKGQVPYLCVHRVLNKYQVLY